PLSVSLSESEVATARSTDSNNRTLDECTHHVHVWRSDNLADNSHFFCVHILLHSRFATCVGRPRADMLKRCRAQHRPAVRTVQLLVVIVLLLLVRDPWARRQLRWRPLDRRHGPKSDELPREQARGQYPKRDPIAVKTERISASVNARFQAIAGPSAP